MSSRISSAEILAVGTELTTGATRDTNSGDLARELTAAGVRVTRTSALPDDLATVTDAFRAALGRAQLVVSTGGLGPTPDDLTREAIAAACAVETYVDPDLLAWLEELFQRRGAPMPETNRKQAWLIPGARSLANGHGTAPGWLVTPDDEHVIVALPGPPREMWPMWREFAMPVLTARGLGSDRASRTLRLTGIGESALVPLIGEDVLRAANPQVATYARAEAVDVVVSAAAEGGTTAAELVDRTVTGLRERIGAYEFAEGEAGWVEALASRLAGRTLATVEAGTAGQLATLLGAAGFMTFAELVALPDEVAHLARDLAHYAQRVRELGHADVGLAVYARQARDTHVRLAVATDAGVREVSRVAFLGGDEGRRRAATLACAVLWELLRQP